MESETTKRIEISDTPIENYSCGICKELLYRPVSLLCQHCYCYKCLQTYYLGDSRIIDSDYPDIVYHTDKNKKCPLCNIPYTLPPIENTMLASVLEHRFPQEYQKRRYTVEHDQKLADLKAKDERDIRKEIWNAISTRFDEEDAPEDNGQHGRRNRNEIVRRPVSFSERWYNVTDRLWDLIPFILIVPFFFQICYIAGKGLEKLFN